MLILFLTVVFASTSFTTGCSDCSYCEDCSSCESCCDCDSCETCSEDCAEDSDNTSQAELQ